MLAAVASPVVQQIEGRAGDARIALRAPLLHALADQVDESEFLPCAARRVFVIAERRFGIAIEVPGRPASFALLRRRAFDDVPMRRWFVEWRIEYRFWYFVVRHAVTPDGRSWSAAVFNSGPAVSRTFDR